MNGPKRFLASKGLKADLLASARGDRAPDASRRRALLAAGVAATAAATSTSSLAAGLGGSVVRWAAWKWVAAGLASTVAVVTARAILVPPAHEKPAMVSVAVPTAPAAPVAARAPTGDLAPPVEAPPPAAPLPVEPVARPLAAARPAALGAKTAPKADPKPAEDVAPDEPVPSVSTQLALETPMIADAQHDIKAGDPAAALRALDGYNRTFPHGMLAAEATGLRIEALARAGRRDEAREELSVFRASNPNHPMLELLDKLLK
jgi:hypothetical protein